MHRLVPLSLSLVLLVSSVGTATAQSSPSPEELERNKQNVVAYYEMAFNWNMPAEAVAQYQGPVYIQHNPLAPNGGEAFIAFVSGFKSQFPNARVDIKRVMAEGDMVVTHSHFKVSPEDRGSAVVDIFRLDENGKIVEHWDVIQAVPERSLNDNTMF